MKDSPRSGSSSLLFRLSLSRWFAAPMLICAAMLVTLPGCGGCTKEKTKAELEAEKKKKEAELKKKKKKKKPDFEIGRVSIQPVQREEGHRLFKPGHWASATQPMKTNNYDYVGELIAEVLDKSTGRPVGLEQTPFRITTARPAALPKGQQKYFEMTFFVPHATKQARVQSVLRGRNAGGEIRREPHFFRAMPPYQYFLVVLAKSPPRYGFVKTAQSVNAPWSDAQYIDRSHYLHYHVVAPKPKRPLPVPSHPLTWTTIAYLIWDDIDPDLLSIEQQQALIDWLHWGGQVIISGPGSLDSLKGSFLEPYLPAGGGDAREFDATDLEELNQYWTIRPEENAGSSLAVTKPWSGVELIRRGAGQAVPGTGDLVFEAPVGRGRVVVSAFRLTERDLTTWKAFDGFLNGCLFRRPARKYEIGIGGDVQVSWLDKTRSPIEPLLNSKLRYFSRDTGIKFRPAVAKPEPYDAMRVQFGVVDGEDLSTGLEHEAYDPAEAGGVASWNPQSITSNAAREALREAAGIVVPSGSFVIWVLALYLAVLVPANWLVFWVIGRVEWAWVAAPIVALVFSVLVVRMAQLDIGFARAQTEIAVVEIQGDHPRAHLTRYTALYTSLSTTYDVHFESDTALSQPFPVDLNFQMLPGQSRTDVTYRRFDDVSLTDLRIASNTTGMVHSEQMVDLGGPIKLGRSTGGQPMVVNGSKYALSDVAVVQNDAVPGEELDDEGRDTDNHPSLRISWIGDLPAGRSAVLGLQTGTLDAIRDRRQAAAPSGARDRLNLRTLEQLATMPEPGELRLVGRINQLIPGASITPAARQITAAALVVAHLKYADLPDPERDENCEQEVKRRELESE